MLIENKGVVGSLFFIFVIVSIGTLRNLRSFIEILVGFVTI